MMNGIYSCDGAPPFLRPFGSKPAELERPTFGRLPVAFQGAYITPYMVSVGAPAAYPRLLKGDGFTVLPDRNAVTLSIAVGSQNLRIGRKGKRETTLKGSPNTANGAPLQGAYITPYMVSVGAPAAYPRLLKGDGFTVLPDRNATGPGRDSSTTARPSWPSTPTSPGESTPPDDAPEYDDYLG